jgi:hypothetical protein
MTLKRHTLPFSGGKKPQTSNHKSTKCIKATEKPPMARHGETDG